MKLLLLVALAAADAPLAPDARAAAAPDRSFDLQAMHLDLVLEPERRGLSGVGRYRVLRLGPGPLVLDQVDLDIQDVRAKTGTLGDWWLDGERLFIEVEGDRAEIELAWSATPTNGMHFREGKGPDRRSEVWTQGEAYDHRHWFPGWDHPNDRFIYTGTVQAPPGWKATTNTGAELVNYLVAVAAGEYEAHVHPDRPTVDVWVEPGTDASVLDRVLTPVPDMLDHFGARSGVPYAWGKYRQVFVQRFMYTGMENTGLTINHDKLLVDDRSAQSHQGPESVVAHEAAHQWFGDLLTCRSFRELWLNEGLATFMTGDWFAKRDGPDVYAQKVDGWYKHGRTSQAMAGGFHLGPEAPTHHNVYSKGAATLQMLRAWLGEEKFWASIRRYTTTHANSLVETRDLQRAFEDETGQHLDWFFQQWVWLPHMPELSASHRYQDGRVQLTLKRTDDGPDYSMPVRADFYPPDGPPVRVEGWLTGRSLELATDLAGPPRFVALDPDAGLLPKIAQEQTVDAWSAQLQEGTPWSRRVAARALGETDEPGALATVLADTTAPQALRTLAAESLGKQGAAAALRAALADADSGVRMAAAEALRSCPQPAAAAVLQALIRRDRDPNVRAQALRSLAYEAPPSAVRLARGLTRARTRGDQAVAVAALDVLGQHGTPADLGILLDPRGQDRLRVNGLRSAAKLVALQPSPDARKSSAKPVSAFAVRLLDDLDLRTRQAAIGILAELGEPKAIPHLEARKRQENTPYLEKAIQKAIDKIRARKDGPALAPSEVESRLEALEERLEAIESDWEAHSSRY